MAQNEKKANNFYLKWPWNLVVYILLVIFLRIFAIPVILLLMAWQKKQQPEGPEEGYCLQRTRQRLSGLLWALLFLFLTVIFIGAFFYQLPMDKTYWDTKDTVFFYVSGPVGLVFAAICIYTAYAAIRDTFFPEKSALAKSIRAQLPFPDEAPPVKELFAMVDNDLRENGVWLDRVGVGKEWVLGDVATYIPRIRCVFGRDEIKHHHSKNRTTTTRIIELYIIDDRKQVQITSLKDPRELSPLLDCLKLRAPDALFLPYAKYTNYNTMSDDEWEELERQYRLRKAERERKADQAVHKDGPTSTQPKSELPAWLRGETANAQQSGYQPRPAQLSLISASGARQAHDSFTKEDVQVAADGIISGEYRQVDLTHIGGFLWIQIKAGDKSDGRCTVTATRADPDTLRFFTTKCPHRQAAAYLMDYYDGKLRPQGSDWKDITKKMTK